MNFVVITPFTKLKINCSDSALLGIDFTDQGRQSVPKTSKLARQVVEQIGQYILNAHTGFNLPLAPVGTVFQQKVWQALLAIPTGEVRTYGDIARQLKSSPRAVGNACRANPIPLVIPCHRVISASGIGGFAGDVDETSPGSRLSIKRKLLSHEGVEI